MYLCISFPNKFQHFNWIRDFSNVNIIENNKNPQLNKAKYISLVYIYMYKMNVFSVLYICFSDILDICCMVLCLQLATLFILLFYPKNLLRG